MVNEPIFTVPATKVTGREHFAKLLRATRNAAGRSIASYAFELGCSSGAVILREQGHRNITVADAVRHLELAGYDLVVMPAGIVAAPGGIDAFRDPQA